MPLKNWCSIHARWSKSSLKRSIHFCGLFPSLKQNFIAYRSSSCPDCIFEIPQLWQSGFSRVNYNCYCSCSFEPEIIKIGQSSHKMYSNNILNFQVFSTISNACTKKTPETYWRYHIYHVIRYQVFIFSYMTSNYMISSYMIYSVIWYQLFLFSYMISRYMISNIPIQL